MLLATICRKAAIQIVSGDKKRVTITQNLEDIIGKQKFRYGQAEKENQIGVATGLAYTTVGGDTLQIEVSLSAGKGKLQLTGKLGDVMKESAQTAFLMFGQRQRNLESILHFMKKMISIFMFRKVLFQKMALLRGYYSYSSCFGIV